MYKVANPIISTWPTIFSTLQGPRDEVVIVKEVGRNAFELDATPPLVSRRPRNKLKAKQQRIARKRACK